MESASDSDSDLSDLDHGVTSADHECDDFWDAGTHTDAASFGENNTEYVNTDGPWGTATCVSFWPTADSLVTSNSHE